MTCIARDGAGALASSATSTARAIRSIVGVPYSDRVAPPSMSMTQPWMKSAFSDAR